MRGNYEMRSRRVKGDVREERRRLRRQAVVMPSVAIRLVEDVVDSIGYVCWTAVRGKIWYEVDKVEMKLEGGSSSNLRWRRDGS